jgi:hypothetical protein
MLLKYLKSFGYDMVGFDVLVEEFKDFFGKQAKIGDQIILASYRGTLWKYYIWGADMRSASWDPDKTSHKIEGFRLLVRDIPYDPAIRNDEKNKYFTQISLQEFKSRCIIWQSRR